MIFVVCVLLCVFCEMGLFKIGMLDIYVDDMIYGSVMFYYLVVVVIYVGLFNEMLIFGGLLFEVDLMVEFYFNVFKGIIVEEMNVMDM